MKKSIPEKRDRNCGNCKHFKSHGFAGTYIYDGVWVCNLNKKPMNYFSRPCKNWEW